MTKERRYYHTVNISDLPEVVRLAEEAKRARRPIRLTIDDQDAGVLVPPRQTGRSEAARPRPRAARRSRLLAGVGAVTPTGKPENWPAVREEVEQAIAREAMEHL
jgi:hypothetical protein